MLFRSNYWSFSSRKNGQIILNNFYESSSGQIISRDLTKANFTNCIIYGNNTNEIELSKSEDQSFDFNYLFSDCLIKVEDTTDSQYNNCIFNPKAIIIDGISHDPVFNDQTNQDFKLFNQSTALNHGAIIPGLEQDFLGISRDNPCDLGPYEFTE